MLSFSQVMAENCNSVLWQRIFSVQMLHSGVKFPYTWQQSVNFFRFWTRSSGWYIVFVVFWVARKRRYFKPWRMPPETWMYADSQSLAVWSPVIKRDIAHALIFQSTSYQKRRLIYFFVAVRNWRLRHKIPTAKCCQKMDWKKFKLYSHCLMYRTVPCRLYETAQFTRVCHILYLGAIFSIYHATVVIHWYKKVMLC